MGGSSQAATAVSYRVVTAESFLRRCDLNIHSRHDLEVYMMMQVR